MMTIPQASVPIGKDPTLPPDGRRLRNAQGFTTDTMSAKAHKALALMVLATAVVIGAGALTAFLWHLYAGPLNRVALGMGETERLVFNTFLSSLFFLQHSGMIRRSFRRRIGGFVRSHYQGAAYTVASGSVLGGVVAFWQGSDIILLHVDGLPALVMRTAYFLSILGTCWGMVALGAIDMFGVDPIVRKLKAKPSMSMPFTVAGPYRWVRHPLYLFMIVLFWSCPQVTVDRLLFNILWTAWMVIGTLLEERDLVADFGDSYRRYQSTVPMIVPTGIFPAYPPGQPGHEREPTAFKHSFHGKNGSTHENAKSRF